MSKSIEEMPEYLSTQHLIQLGIYPSIDAAYQARIQGYSPSYIKLRHKILYQKQAVIEFLEQRMRHKNNDAVNPHHAKSCSQENQ